MVTFVAEDDGESITLYVGGPEENRVDMALVLRLFQVPMVSVKDITLDKNIVMQAGKDGLSLHTFEVGKTYQLTRRHDARPAVEPAPSAGTLSLFKVQRQDDSYKYLGVDLRYCYFALFDISCPSVDNEKILLVELGFALTKPCSKFHGKSLLI
jgi:hypothetical protein